MTFLLRRFGAFRKHMRPNEQVARDVAGLDFSRDAPAGGAGWQATHQHRKGGLYRVLGRGTLEADRSDVVIYQDVQGKIWVRAVTEFEDGRFKPV
ncbi:DUF1653 domain-containing protein [Roseovarius aestuarii]|uniref:DUF1653 domain-containing protein n=1 Tax=Roseovarius aestuarii TaxID=475083 RepID=A0A1X7BU88_9RHOB|nr:DUF1653 domain-containing protein [Roseovarius aestuarii]SMC13246.1 hypothetical protein ROA7745_03091 [Roseovarius aestuarii]